MLTDRLPDAVRRQGKRAFVWLLVPAVVLASSGLFFVLTPYHGPADGVRAVGEGDAVDVSRAHGGYVLEPGDDPTAAGLVFYPGGRVHPDAYVESLAPLAREANVRVVIPKAPLNLAVLDQGVAGRIVDDDIDWYVGGHSLGGVMACRYAANHPDRVAGVLLFGSYCDRDLSGTNLLALSVVGDADGVLNRDAYRRHLADLPADAAVRELPGLNHSQFGSYHQAGDAPSGTTYATAHERLAAVIVPWFENETGRAG
ncbi:MAG: alpha/beta fold hydrolase [Haloarculaceae archaeon]